MNKKILGSAIILACAAAGVSTSANAALASNAVLNIVSSTCGGVDCVYDSYGSLTNGPINGGSYFAMDTNGSKTFTAAERVDVTALGGITLGTAQAAGTIDTWSFYGAVGQHMTTQGLSVVSSVGNTAVIDMNGWTVFWNNGQIDMGQGTDPTITCGVDCGVGDTFSMTYVATVPSGGFAGVMYQLRLVGTIGAGASAVPVPAAVWLFGSGLLGLAGVARRRKAA